MLLRGRLLLIAVSLAAIAAGGVSALQLADPTPSAMPLPSAVPLAAQPSVLPPTTSPTVGTRSTTPAPTGPGVPVAIDIPVASSHYPRGMHARITAHALNPDHTLFVPDDPAEVAWASDDAAPGSDRGTVILVSHVNFVIDGRTVSGAFADLAEYGERAVGRIVSLQLRDGRTLGYRIVSSQQYSKDELAADPGLRRTLYDQTRSFGQGEQRGSRLLLVSCGGPFDPHTGEYEDNVFVFALPVR
jgi:hypothetical protein